MEKKNLTSLILGIILVIIFTAAIILFVVKYEKETVLQQQSQQQPAVTVSDTASEVNHEEAEDLPQAEETQFATENGKFLQ